MALTSCATLNEEECAVADWYVIGLEDGEQGRAESYLGKHRSACAEYAVAPDFSQYQLGRQRGVLQYCTVQQGYRLGRQGKPLNPVCPDTHTVRFETAYASGKKIYQTEKAVRAAEKQVAEIESEIDALVKSNRGIEANLIHGFGSPEHREEALRTLKYQDEALSDLHLRLNEWIRKEARRTERLQLLERAVPLSN